MKQVAILLGFICVTQHLFSQLDYGVKAGLNLANQNIRVNAFGMKADRFGDPVLSFHAGGFIDFPIAHKFSIRAELLLSGKGSTFNEEDEMGDDESIEIRPYYLEVPLSVLYTHQTRSGTRLFGGIGPAFSYGVAGNIKSDGETEKIFQEDGFRRLDIGLNLTAGVELPSRLFISVNYNHGLTNLVDTDGLLDGEGNVKWTNNSINLSVGYFLKRR